MHLKKGVYKNKMQNNKFVQNKSPPDQKYKISNIPKDPAYLFLFTKNSLSLPLPFSL